MVTMNDLGKTWLFPLDWAFPGFFSFPFVVFLMTVGEECHTKLAVVLAHLWLCGLLGFTCFSCAPVYLAASCLGVVTKFCLFWVVLGIWTQSLWYDSSFFVIMFTHTGLWYTRNHTTFIEHAVCSYRAVSWGLCLACPGDVGIELRPPALTTSLNL